MANHVCAVLADIDMDASNAAATKPDERSNRSYQRQKASKVAKVEKKRQRRPKNSITFKKHPMKTKVKKR